MTEADDVARDAALQTGRSAPGLHVSPARTERHAFTYGLGPSMSRWSYRNARASSVLTPDTRLSTKCAFSQSSSAAVSSALAWVTVSDLLGLPGAFPCGAANEACDITAHEPARLGVGDDPDEVRAGVSNGSS